MQLSGVNFPAILVAAVVQWLLGAVWYGVVFKKRWNTLMGFGAGDKPSNPAFAMVVSFVANLILCFALGHFIVAVSNAEFMAGASLGLICWLGFMAPLLLTGHIYDRRPANLLAINLTYWLLAMVLAGGILAVWR